MEHVEPIATYHPRSESKDILDRAMWHIQSVPYQVTLRWLFYRLLQEGVFQSKQDYHQLKSLTARARKSFYEGWAPNTLADDSRTAYIRGFGYDNAGQWLEAVSARGCTLDKWLAQPHYVELWFEAAAMRAQFEHYTDYIPLRPFKGDPSLDFKWKIAQHLNSVQVWFPGKPVIVLYFGDYDPKGLQIPLSAVEDIKQWSRIDFRFQRCGLNKGDAVRYNLPDNPEKPGTYQWEALDDVQASTVIQSSVGKWIDTDALAQVEEQEEAISQRFTAEIPELIKKLG
jgi:hypothetical protein